MEKRKVQWRAMYPLLGGGEPHCNSYSEHTKPPFRVRYQAPFWIVYDGQFSIARSFDCGAAIDMAVNPLRVLREAME